MGNLLDIRHLTVVYHTEEDEVHALSDVSFSLQKGETLGLVGETGAGKTTTALAIMGLLPKRVGEVQSGEILFEGRDLLRCSDADMRAIRGASISMIFQDPMTSLNPTLRIGDQIAESIRQHQPDMKRADVERRVDEILEMVGIPAARKREYPHQFSGGMKQRVVIAIALALEPQLLIADEPTTALDVTIQAQVLQMMGDLQRQLGTSTILITHDLGVVAGIADRVAVMYAGKVVETGTTKEIFYEHRHPYTEALLRSLPSTDQGKREPLMSIPGTPPDLLCPPKGCGFAARCRHCMQICKEEQPPEFELNAGHKASCWLLHPDCPSAEERGAK